ncbi:hypothetical protein P879_06359 [Paragonimus westermani]|uniref:Oxidation resistance protein 1 n=1 Tax=Paragonimus westermani TaxID=34504 RepID=A0A8T0DHC1_9TREM|nr:hypothetical protein P879_06359 [Paragonimus westermani]
MQNLPAEAEGLDWQLVYSTAVHGFRLRTLYYRCSMSQNGLQSSSTNTMSFVSSSTSTGRCSPFCRSQPCLVVLRASNGEAFGAMLNTHPYASGGRFYGNGSCFVFRWLMIGDHGEAVGNAEDVERKKKRCAAESVNSSPILCKRQPDNEESVVLTAEEKELILSDTDSTVSTEIGVDISHEFSRLFHLNGPEADISVFVRDDKRSFEKYAWSGKNDFFISGDHESLSIGCSQGHSALCLDDMLLHGRTESCETFDNPPLCSTCDFTISNLEVWSFC